MIGNSKYIVLPSGGDGRYPWPGKLVKSGRILVLLIVERIACQSLIFPSLAPSGADSGKSGVLNGCVTGYLHYIDRL